MTLQELLDELARNILRDRSDLMSGPDDSLWSDETLVRYINEAENILARKGMVLRDSVTASVTELALIAGQSEYILHPSVVAVISAKIDGDVGDLSRAGHSVFNNAARPDGYFFDAAYLTRLPPGKPLAFSTDETLEKASRKSGVVSLRIYPEISDVYDGTLLKLRVVRKPLKQLSLDNLEASPEVPEDYHLGLLDWAAYRALRNVDTDAEGVAKADKFRESFEILLKQAWQDTARKVFAPAAWGFGRNGFVWE